MHGSNEVLTSPRGLRVGLPRKQLTTLRHAATVCVAVVSLLRPCERSRGQPSTTNPLAPQLQAGRTQSSGTNTNSRTPAAAAAKIATVDLRGVFERCWKTKKDADQIKSLEAEAAKQRTTLLADYRKARQEYEAAISGGENQTLPPEERQRRKTARPNSGI